MNDAVGLSVFQAPDGGDFSDVFLEKTRAEMLRFARLQLGNDEVEDAVQEAIVGALKNAQNFRGEAALKTWMIAILKNKIADILRQRQRRPIPASQMMVDDDTGALPDIFDRRGMWHDSSKPLRWADPEAAIYSSQFLAIFDACLNRLPMQQGRVFMMREVVEMETDEICNELGLSVSNIHVILHRARLGLRACLEANWYQKDMERC